MTQNLCSDQETAASMKQKTSLKPRKAYLAAAERRTGSEERENELNKSGNRRIEELETRDKEIDETMVLPDICTNVAECRTQPGKSCYSGRRTGRTL